jgi:hypothetical protein
VSDAYPFTLGIADGEPYKLYLATNPAVQSGLNLRPFHIGVQPIDFYADSFEFRDYEYEITKLLAFVRLAHSMSSGDLMRVMPRWMLVDLALMPSGVLLALAGQDEVNSKALDLERGRCEVPYAHGREHAAMLRDLLQIAHDRQYDGPLPVAGYAAIPTLLPGCWVGGSLWWSLVPGQKLGYTVRRIALECYRAEREIGVTQFANTKALRAQRGFGRLRVTHTNLAVHPQPGTFVYEVDLLALPADGIPAPVTGSPAGALEVNPIDRQFAAQLLSIQEEIDQGASCYIMSGAQIGDRPVIFTEFTSPARPPAATSSLTAVAQSAATAADAAEAVVAEPAAESSAEGKDQDDFFTREIRTGVFRPYIMSNASMLDQLDLAPFGIQIEHIDFCAQTFGEKSSEKKYEVPKLFDLLNRAIAFSYTESGLGTPKWAMVELALMPSAVLLVMADQDHLKTVADELAKEPVIDRRTARLVPLAEDDRDRLCNANSLRDLLSAAKEHGYHGPLPIAGCAAAPTPQEGLWVGWSLWSLVPGKRLGYTVKRLGLACYGVRKQSAVIQFQMTRGLDVIAKFGMLRLTTVDVRPHPAPHAFIYEIDVSKLPVDGSAVQPSKRRKAKWLLNPDGDNLAKDLERMQRGIVRGTRYYLLARTAGKASSPMIPVYQRTLPHRWLWASTKLLCKHAKSQRAAKRRTRYSS